MQNAYFRWSISKDREHNINTSTGRGDMEVNSGSSDIQHSLTSILICRLTLWPLSSIYSTQTWECWGTCNTQKGRKAENVRLEAWIVQGQGIQVKLCKCQTIFWKYELYSMYTAIWLLKFKNNGKIQCDSITNDFCHWRNDHFETGRGCRKTNYLTATVNKFGKFNPKSQ